ncbi:MAG: hypothetical protein WB760_19005 [Xanthobacteraceae bacterium]
MAVLEGFENGKPVTYGEQAIQAPDDHGAKEEAVDWGADLHKKVGKKATLVLKKGSRGIHSHKFESV